MCHAVCNFCGEKIADVGKMRKDEQCCDDMNLIKYIGMNVCQTCGVVNGYDFVNRYCDFYENV